jgi:DNA primase
VVEGFFDCLKLHQAGVESVVALLGAALYPSQQRLLLQHFRCVILMLDGDDTGRGATRTIAAQLQPHASVRVIHLPDAVQPDQLSTETIRRLWQAHSEPATLCRHY